jgi:hypothetical protein
VSTKAGAGRGLGRLPEWRTRTCVIIPADENRRVFAVTETPIPGGARAGGNAPDVIVRVPAGGAVAAGIEPAVVVATLIPLLAEALDRFDQVTAFHAHPPPDHHDDVALYTDAAVALMAFVIAMWMMLDRAFRAGAGSATRFGTAIQKH